MPALNVVTVDPDELEVDIDISQRGGASVTAYTGATGATPISLPATISTPTAFWLPVNVDYTFIVSVGGSERYRTTVGVSDRTDDPKIVLLRDALTLGDAAAGGGGGSGASGLPTPTAGDARKMLEVADSEDAYELIVPASFTAVTLRIEGGSEWPAQQLTLTPKDPNGTDPSTTFTFAAGVPLTLGAGGHFLVKRLSSVVTGARDLVLHAGNLIVSNGAGTQKLDIEFAVNQNIDDGNTYALDDSNIDEQVGSDLAFSTPDKVVSTAGGQFFVTVMGRFDNVAR